MGQYGKREGDSFRVNSIATGWKNKAVKAVSYGSGEAYVSLAEADSKPLGIFEAGGSAIGAGATVTYFGITRAKVGLATIPGVDLTVANSGWLTPVNSGGYRFAEALTHTASGFMATVFIKHAGFNANSIFNI